MSWVNASAPKVLTAGPSGYLTPGAPLRPDITRACNPYDKGRLKTTRGAANEEVVKYWEARGYNRNAGLGIGGGKLLEQKSQLARAVPRKEIKDDDPKYKNQRSHIILGDDDEWPYEY